MQRKKIIQSMFTRIELGNVWVVIKLSEAKASQIFAWLYWMIAKKICLFPHFNRENFNYQLLSRQNDYYTGYEFFV